MTCEILRLQHPVLLQTRILRMDYSWLVLISVPEKQKQVSYCVNQSKVKMYCVNQSDVSIICVNQSEVNIILGQPIRSQQYIVSTNQKQLLSCVNQSEASIYLRSGRNFVPGILAIRVTSPIQRNHLVSADPCFTHWTNLSVRSRLQPLKQILVQSLINSSFSSSASLGPIEE